MCELSMFVNQHFTLCTRLQIQNKTNEKKCSLERLMTLGEDIIVGDRQTDIHTNKNGNFGSYRYNNPSSGFQATRRPE